MSEVTDELIENLAKLSRIALTKEDRALLFNDMKRVIGFIDLLNEVSVKEEQKAHSHVYQEHGHHLREDRPKDLLPRDLFLKNAPDQIGGMIRVPPVILKDE